MSPEGTHSLLSVCYSAFRDRLTQTETFNKVSLQTSSSPRRCRLVARGGYFTHRLREVNNLSFDWLLFYPTPSLLPPRSLAHSERDFRRFFQLEARSLEADFAAVWPVPFVSGGQ